MTSQAENAGGLSSSNADFKVTWITGATSVLTECVLSFLQP